MGGGYTRGGGAGVVGVPGPAESPPPPCELELCAFWERHPGATDHAAN